MISAPLFLVLGACNQQQKLGTPFPPEPNAPLIDTTGDVNSKITQSTPEPTPEPTAVESIDQSTPPTTPQRPDPEVMAEAQPQLQQQISPPTKPAPQNQPTRPQVKGNPELSKKWNHKGGPLTKVEILALLKFGEGDPVVQSIIEDSVKAIHGTTASDLVNWVQVCPKLGLQGEYRPDSQYILDPIHNDELLNPSLTPQHLEDFKESLEKDSSETFSTEVHADYIDAYYSKREKICLPTTDTSIEEVYLSLIHELVHFSRLKPDINFLTFLDRYPDKDSYIKTKLSEPGDEIEAFRLMFHTQIKLDQGTAALPARVKGLFNEQGDLINKDKLREVLNGWGYYKRIGDFYKKKLKDINLDVLDLKLTLISLTLERIGNRSPVVHDSFIRLNKETDDLEALTTRVKERIDKKE